MRQLVASLAAVAALACHPARPQAEPVLAADSAVGATVACVHTALAASSRVARVEIRPDHPRVAFLALTNAAGVRLSSVSFVVEPQRGAPRQFVVEYVVPPNTSGGGMKPSTDPKLVEIQDQATTDVARQLLSEVGPQCAQTAPVAAICSLTADIGNKSARTGRCSIGI